MSSLYLENSKATSLFYKDSMVHKKLMKFHYLLQCETCVGAECICDSSLCVDCSVLSTYR